MQHFELAECHLFSHEVYVQFYMLCPSMVNWILGEVYSRHIVAVDHCGFVNDDVKLS